MPSTRTVLPSQEAGSRNSFATGIASSFPMSLPNTSQPGTGEAVVGGVSEAQRLPVASKILKSLARRGLLTSHRGSKGGFSLVRPADLVESHVALQW